MSHAERRNKDVRACGQSWAAGDAVEHAARAEALLARDAEVSLRVSLLLRGGRAAETARDLAWEAGAWEGGQSGRGKGGGAGAGAGGWGWGQPALGALWAAGAAEPPASEAARADGSNSWSQAEPRICAHRDMGTLVTNSVKQRNML